MLFSGAGHFTVSFRVRMEQFAEENTGYVFSNFIVKITFFQSIGTIPPSAFSYSLTFKSVFNMYFDDYSQQDIL